MKTFRRILACAALALAPAAHAQDIQPGSWNIQMSLAAGSEPPTPASGSTICLKSLSDAVNAGTGCTAHTTSVSGSHVDMNLSCGVGGLKMNGTGSLTVAPTSIDGTLNLTMQMAGDEPVPTVTTMHAVRAGDCQK